jgi:hypothetical protein
MKFRLLLMSTFIASLLIVGCEDDNDDDSSVSDTPDSPITVTKSVGAIEWNGPGLDSQVTTEDDYILDLDNTVISRQRPSCSGFDIATIGEIAVGDIVEITYYTHGEGTDLALRTIAPTTAKFFRYECVYPEPDDQWIYDGDRDGYTDNIDAYPNDPTRH